MFSRLWLVCIEPVKGSELIAWMTNVTILPPPDGGFRYVEAQVRFLCEEIIPSNKCWCHVAGVKQISRMFHSLTLTSNMSIPSQWKSRYFLVVNVSLCGHHSTPRSRCWHDASAGCFLLSSRSGLNLTWVQLISLKPNIGKKAERT